jgi:Protein of unknown function (DUF1688)
MNTAVAVLREPATIRLRCANVLRAVEAGRSAHFTVERGRLGAVAQRVANLTRARFADGRIPYHSRWRHFEAGNVDRKAELEALLAGHDAAALARARIDLALISVLLDAGAGPQWRYAERESGQTFTRSEGLAVASFRAFMAGRYSSDPAQPCRVDAQTLVRIDAASLSQDFQVGPENPLVGLEGRAALLRRLGEALIEQPQTFGTLGRPGQLYDALATAPLTAARILASLLDSFSAIWPSGQALNGVPLGDAWRHELAGGEGASAGWVPFHKLSQWLAYSLLEPFEWAGVPVQGLDALTGLPEYRNGGLLLDAGVIIPRDAAYAQRRYSPADPWVIEWRALTVALIDELAPLVRGELGLTAAQMPLACVLEGGTWAAGRAIAAEKRAGGAPPVSIDSDGTVF